MLWYIRNNNQHPTCRTVIRCPLQSPRLCLSRKKRFYNGIRLFFSGLGNVGKPVSFVLDPYVVPVQAPWHRVPVAKRERVKLKLNKMVRDGKLAKVEEPTALCSNITVVKRVKPDGSVKTRLYMPRPKPDHQQSHCHSKVHGTNLGRNSAGVGHAQAQMLHDY